VGTFLPNFYKSFANRVWVVRQPVDLDNLRKA